MERKLLQVLVLTICLLATSAKGYEEEETIFPDEEEEDWGVKDKSISMLDVRTTTFFNILPEILDDEEEEALQQDADGLEEILDIFPWKSS